MANAREHIVETACDLIESQGYHATGLNQIVQESGSPKGSLYYYFPDGKEAIAEEAIRLAGMRTAARIEAGLANGEKAAPALRDFIYKIALQVEASEYRLGGPLMTVAMETATSSERLNLACREAYGMLQETFEKRLVQDGFNAEEAGDLALFINACIEGGVVMSRTLHSADPLRKVADYLEKLLSK